MLSYRALYHSSKGQRNIVDSIDENN